MSNLIINGIDHSKLDIEWSKRGGIVAVQSTYAGIERDYVMYRAICADEVTYFINCNDTDDVLADIHIAEYFNFRMATPAECADAGVEYIEPPTRWLPMKGGE